MADIRAAQSGDFSATSTWVGGVVPGSGDIAYANTFTITISDTRTVQAISNASGTSITVGGTFSLLNGCNLTCTNANGVVQGATSTSCITTPSLGVGSLASVTANIQFSGGLANTNLITFSTSGTLNTIGNLTGQSSAFSVCHVIGVTGAGVLNHTGSVTGGSSSSGGCHGIAVSATSTVNITGNVIGGINQVANYGLSISGAAANVTVTGNVTASNQAAAIVNNNAATLTVNGVCQSSSTQPAILGGSANQITRLSGPFLLGASGNINPVQAQSWRWAPTQIPTYMEVVASNGSTKRNLYTADNMPSGGYPTTNNVRSGTVYGPSSENTGTLAVPSASSVALGVAVDNTTGTAILTAANVRTAVGLASANLDTQLAAIPSAAAIASAVWSAASRTLSDASNVASAVWSAVARTITGGTVDTLTNAPTVPSAAAIASQVRTELSTELGRIDVATSTRLAPSGTLARVTLADTVTTLTNAPTVPSAAAIASQVRSELTPELARVGNCSTVDTVATTIQDALSPN